jgi:tripartite ATP-independent transporter DctP family solute receptor
MAVSTKVTKVGVLVLSLLLIGGSAWVQPQIGQAAERTLKFAHIMSPEHYMHKAAVLFTKEVREKTQGRIEVRLFPSEQLGTERQIMEGLKFGSIEMGIVAGNIIEGFEPVAALLSLPYLIRDFEHAFHVEDGPIGDKMKAKILKTTRVRPLAFNMTGIRSVLRRDKAIRKFEDFKGLKIRVPESPIMVSTFKHLGANPTPIPWGELYTALQTKVVDACESPPPTLYDGKFFEVAKNLTLTNHIYTNQFILINEKMWQGFSEPDKAIIGKAAVDYLQNYERKLAVGLHTKIIERVKGEGVKVFPIDTKPMQKAVRPMYQEFGKKIGGMSLIDGVINTP